MYGTTPVNNRAARHICILCGVAILASELAHPADHVHIHVPAPQFPAYIQQIAIATTSAAAAAVPVDGFISRRFRGS